MLCDLRASRGTKYYVIKYSSLLKVAYCLYIWKRTQIFILLHTWYLNMYQEFIFLILTFDDLKFKSGILT